MLTGGEWIDNTWRVVSGASCCPGLRARRPTCRHLEREFVRLYSGGVRWRWVFSSSNLLPSIAINGVMRAAKDVYCRLLNLIFPEDCHVCGERLREVSRVPVCRRCLTEPAPMQAEFFCTSCRTPFLNRAPLDESGQCSPCRLGLTGFDTAYAYGSHEGALRKCEPDRRGPSPKPVPVHRCLINRHIAHRSTAHRGKSAQEPVRDPLGR